MSLGTKWLLIPNFSRVSTHLRAGGSGSWALMIIFHLHQDRSRVPLAALVTYYLTQIDLALPPAAASQIVFGCRDGRNQQVESLRTFMQLM